MTVLGPKDPRAVHPSTDERAIQLVSKRVKGVGYVSVCELCGKSIVSPSSGMAQADYAVHLAMKCEDPEFLADFEAKIMANLGTRLEGGSS